MTQKVGQKPNGLFQHRRRNTVRASPSRNTQIVIFGTWCAGCYAKMLKNTLKSYASHIFQVFQDFQQIFSTVDIHQRCWSSRVIKKKVRSGGDEGSLGSLCLATVGLLPRAKTALIPHDSSQSMNYTHTSQGQK